MARASIVLQQKVGGQATDYFDVGDYGALGDGTHDDSTAIRNAYNAAFANSVGGKHSTVRFLSGHVYAVSYANRWNLSRIRSNDWVGASNPTVYCKGIVCFEGAGAGATIRYPSYGTDRFCWVQSPNPTAAGDTYGNVEMNNLVIDHNHRQPSADAGSVLWITGFGNMDNINLHDFSTTALVADRVTYNQSRTEMGVYLQGKTTSRAQPNMGYGTNLTVKNAVIHAQSKSVAMNLDITGDTTDGATQYMFDNLLCDTVTTNNHHHCGTGIHLGGKAAGWRCQVLNCDVSDSSDNGIEIDQFNEIYGYNCSAHGMMSGPMGFTWFAFPYKDTPPNIVLDGMHWSGDCGPYWDVNTTPEPAPQSPRLSDYMDRGSSPLRTRSWGNLTVKNSDAVFGLSNSYSLHNYVIRSMGPMDSVTLDNIDITDVGTGGSLIYLHQNSALSSKAAYHIHDVRWRSSSGGAYALVPLSKMSLAGSYTLDTDTA